jgi:hypothetical protein
VTRALLLLVLTGLLAPPARAGEEAPPAPPEAVAQLEAWIKDLASEQYEVREAARKGLERRGREAPDVLRAHADDADPEVRRTVRALLERLGSVTPAPPVASADVARLGLVRLQVTKRPLREVLDLLAGALGGTFVLDAESGKRPVSADLEDVPYFTALETLAAAADLRVPAGFDGEARLAFVPAAEGRAAPASAAVGPVRLRAARVTAARSLDGDGARTHTLGLDLNLAPCVQLVTYRPARVVKAVDPAGRAWRGAGNAGAALTYGVGSDTRRVELSVALEPAAEGVEERLATLDLSLPLRVRHERRQVRFAPLADLPRTLDEQGEPAEAGARGTVTLASLTAAEGRKDAWIVDLSAVPTTAPGRESLDAYLITGEGARRRVWISGGRSTTSADGRLRLVGRCYGTGEAPPTALEVVWFEREGEGEVLLTLRDVPLR